MCPGGGRRDPAALGAAHEAFPDEEGLRDRLDGLRLLPHRYGQGAQSDWAAVEALASDGFVELVLWVHPDDQRARRFYEHAGWEWEGTTRQQEVLGIEVPEVRYRRTV